ncbi:hypothetical protein ACH4U3_13430 [Streptomyces griseoruber]|uniref:hypothetical protein n=1 Tax=Streptomyces griseoruber TaxID=1943 RepID=UPI00378B5B6F
MSTRRHLPLKSVTPTPTAPDAANPAAPPAAVGEPTGAARKGVVTAVGSDPTPDRPGIRIYAPPVYRHHYDGARWSTRYGDTPTAAYACPCGHTDTDTATGQQAVAELVTDYAAHKHFCTGTPATLPERRTAA